MLLGREYWPTSHVYANLATFGADRYLDADTMMPVSPAHRAARWKTKQTELMAAAKAERLERAKT